MPQESNNLKSYASIAMLAIVGTLVVASTLALSLIEVRIDPPQLVAIDPTNSRIHNAIIGKVNNEALLEALEADRESLERAIPGHGTPLDTAINWDNVEAVQVLLEAGVSPNDPMHGSEFDGMLPIGFAIKFCDPRIVDLLLRHGAKLDSKDHNQHDAWDIFDETRHSRDGLKEIRALLEEHRAAAE